MACNHSNYLRYGRSGTLPEAETRDQNYHTLDIFITLGVIWTIVPHSQRDRQPGSQNKCPSHSTGAGSLVLRTIVPHTHQGLWFSEQLSLTCTRGSGSQNKCPLHSPGAGSLVLRTTVHHTRRDRLPGMDREMFWSMASSKQLAHGMLVTNFRAFIAISPTACV